MRHSVFVFMFALFVAPLVATRQTAPKLEALVGSTHTLRITVIAAKPGFGLQVDVTHVYPGGEVLYVMSTNNFLEGKMRSSDPADFVDNVRANYRTGMTLQSWKAGTAVTITDVTYKKDRATVRFKTTAGQTGAVHLITADKVPPSDALLPQFAAAFN
jgi:hypothetical protein